MSRRWLSSYAEKNVPTHGDMGPEGSAQDIQGTFIKPWGYSGFQEEALVCTEATGRAENGASFPWGSPRVQALPDPSVPSGIVCGTPRPPGRLPTPSLHPASSLTLEGCPDSSSSPSSHHHLTNPRHTHTHTQADSVMTPILFPVGRTSHSALPKASLQHGSSPEYRSPAPTSLAPPSGVLVTHSSLTWQPSSRAPAAPAGFSSLILPARSCQNPRRHSAALHI